MKIKTVKMIGGDSKETAMSFEVITENNKAFFVINKEGARYRKEVLNFKGIFQHEFITDELVKRKIKEVKQHAFVKITEKYPEYRQLNIMRTYAKTSTEYKEMDGFINGVRKKSDEIEKELQSMNPEELENVNIEELFR